MDTLPGKNFEELRNLGLIDESGYRNFKIKQKFDELKNQGLKTSIIKEILADEFSLSPESIHGIYYRKKEKYRFVN
ncbi:hypothetical protein MASR2M39_08150 [Ignavibacteriales bacterium]|jgi:predicted nuclease with TOPRIM domain